jgi:hypothetical protein
MANASFAKGNPYMFAKSNTVLIKTPHHKYLRAAPNDSDNVDHNGGQGQWARWQVEKDGQVFTFKNVKTGKYLRIKGDGKIDCATAGAGPWTKFTAHKEGGGKAKLESVAHKGKYISIKPNGNINVGVGGAHCLLTFTRQD